MNGIVWLASYPKSGNTWFRAFLANYLADADQPADINKLGINQIASARAPFDTAVGYDSGELTPDEIDALRPEVYLHQARNARERSYCKVHDAYTFLPDGRPLFPPEATDRVIYLVRNPLDVAVSFAHHSGYKGYERAIREMADPAFCLSRSLKTEPNQLRQRLLTWSGHVASWIDAPGLRVKILRYEDMKADPAGTFGAAVRFLELPFDETRLERALRFSRFEQLSTQEATSGFREKPIPAARFFRKGESGVWKGVLSPSEVGQIVDAHREMMLRLGYMPPDGSA